VFAGGSVFKTLPAQAQRPQLALLRNALALGAYARVRGRLVLQVGVGVGRLDTPGAARLARRVAAQADLLVVRDADSARLLASAGVPAPLRVGADPAWTLLDDAPVHLAPQDRVVVVPSRWAVAEAPQHLEILAAALRTLVEGGTQIQVQPWQIGGDRGLDDGDHAQRLAALLDHRAEIVAPPADLPAATHFFAGARLVITARFHGLVAAAAAGVRALAIANEPKQSALAARLGQACVPAAAPAEQVAAGLTAAVDGEPPAAAAVRAEIAAAEEGFGLLRLMLADGREPAENISGLRLEPIW
jgi:polysaccharide pyruvyl transferase WcaK-like protein